MSEFRVVDRESGAVLAGASGEDRSRALAEAYRYAQGYAMDGELVDVEEKRGRGWTWVVRFRDSDAAND